MLLTSFRGFTANMPSYKSFDASTLKVELIKDVIFGLNCDKADFIYIIIDLSKIILNYYSARFQSQERLVYQVDYCIKRLIRAFKLKLTCKHTCMMVKNVRLICSSVTIDGNIQYICWCSIE
ncbi:GTP cyclohydrolase I [Candidatus Hodgkinia cicadicola]